MLKIGGMHCAGCVNSIQKHVSSLQGVQNVEVNLASEKASLEFDPDKIGIAVIEKAIEEAGYRVVYDSVSLVTEGLSDSADAQKLEEELESLDGVRRASVNYANSTLKVEFNSAATTLADIRRKVGEAGYNVLGESAHTTIHDMESKKLRNTFFVALAFAVPAVMYSYPEIFSGIPLAGGDIGAYIAFSCAAVVQFFSGYRFYSGAFRIAKLRSANMDTLVALGTTTAFVFSAANTFPSVNWDGIYYDASALVVTFILLGKYLEIKTKARTSALIRKILELQPKTATIRRDDGTEVETSVDLVRPGDVILVRPGERIPVDSEVIQGESAVDESMISGESSPVYRKVGDSVFGASINREGMLVVKATKIGSDSFLSQVLRLVEDAMGKKPLIQKMVDRVAGNFAYVVMIVAFATFLAWLFVAGNDFPTAIIPAVSILVVACPCALGLATPTAIIVGMSRAASHGVLFKGGDAVEALSKVSVAVFDKTGTLTEGKPSVTDILPLNGAVPNGTSTEHERHILELAATAEQWSEHPLARAVLSKAQAMSIKPAEVDDFQVVPGLGVSVASRGRKIRVGNPAFIESSGMTLSKETKSIIEKLQRQGKTAVAVTVDSEAVAIIGLQDMPKANAKQALNALREMGIEPVMLTGDNIQTAEVIGGGLGIDRVYAGVLPSGKVDVIRQIQQEGKKVLMVGDGFNDAPALTAADAGAAMGAGTDLAIESGNIVLLRNDIHDVVSAAEIARKTVSKIKQNLAYAFIYNIILVPVAALGLLYPALAGLAMAASSVSVTASSLMLKRWKPRSR